MLTHTPNYSHRQENSVYEEILSSVIESNLIKNLYSVSPSMSTSISSYQGMFVKAAEDDIETNLHILPIFFSL